MLNRQLIAPPPIIKNITGNTVGSLTILGYAGQRGRPKHHYWSARCKCGIIYLYRGGDAPTTCDCSRKGKNVKHGMYNTRVYKIWSGMLSRCRTPTNAVYARYGGRGIKTCKRWYVFENFYADMGNPPSSKHSIDRRDNDSDYKPSNCYWATPSQQARNQRRNIWLTINGETRILKDWSKLTNIPVSTLRYRVNHNLPPKLIIAQRTLYKESQVKLSYKGTTLTIPEWANRTGIKANTLYLRARNKWLPAEILGFKSRPVTHKRRRRLITISNETRTFQEWTELANDFTKYH